MDKVFFQSIWQVMESLHNATQLEDALSGSLEILRGVTESNKGSIWMREDQSGRVITQCVWKLMMKSRT